MIYANDWADSIILSHSPSTERDLLLGEHWRLVSKIMQVFSDDMPLIGQLPLNKDSNLQLEIPEIDWI